MLAALCDGTIDRQGFARLEQLLDSDPAGAAVVHRLSGFARRVVLEPLWQPRPETRHSDTRGLGTPSEGWALPPEGWALQCPVSVRRGFRVPGSGFGVRDLGFGARGSTRAPAPSPEPLIPPIVIDTSSPAQSPPLSTLFAPGGWLFSYAAATVITGMAILGAWAYKVSHDYRARRDSRPPTPVPQSPEPKPEYVGRITGMADCRWADPGRRSRRRHAVPLGRRYALASGLMEITYTTGAKVILQGPCTYEVDSAAGGFLSLGKLTARVETKGKAEGGRRRAEIRNPKSEVRIPLPPSSFPFVVRTPTAIVTDLGTEFGVEVDEQGRTESHVFAGEVRVERADAKDGAGQTTVLYAGQTARCDERRGIAVPAAPGNVDRFVRSLRPGTTRVVEKFDGPALGPALEQMPPGRYAFLDGAAVYQHAGRTATAGRRGAISAPWPATSATAISCARRRSGWTWTPRTKRSSPIGLSSASATARPTPISTPTSTLRCFWGWSSTTAVPSCGCVSPAPKSPPLPTEPWPAWRRWAASAQAGTGCGCGRPPSG